MSVQMTDVVNAYLGQAAQLVKVGGSLTMGLIDDLIPDVVTIRWLDGADEETILRAAGDPAAVLALDLSPEGELAGARSENTSLRNTIREKEQAAARERRENLLADVVALRPEEPAAA